MNALLRGIKRGAALLLAAALVLCAVPAVHAAKPTPNFCDMFILVRFADAAGDAFAGRVDQALRASFADLAVHVVYCCGSPSMVGAVRAAASGQGLPDEDFHADVFVPGPSSKPA